MYKQPILIGITGNIGSGKSILLNLLKANGYEVISADLIAQQQLDKADSLKQIVRRWGTDVLKGGKANRSKIAGIVFDHPRELEFLNNVVHPKTLVAFQEIVDTSTRDHLFFEVPLLFEAGLQDCFDYLVLIFAEAETRIKRLMKRDHTTRDKILARMRNQIDDTQKIPLCDLVLENNLSTARFERQCEQFLTLIPTLRSREKLPFSQ